MTHVREDASRQSLQPTYVIEHPENPPTLARETLISLTTSSDTAPLPTRSCWFRDSLLRGGTE